MIGMRMNAFNDTGLGEPEQDANTALIELDKGSFAPLTFLTCTGHEYLLIDHKYLKCLRKMSNNYIINVDMCKICFA